MSILLGIIQCRHSKLVRLAALALGVSVCAPAQVSVLNANYDKEQTAANLQETVLQPGLNWKNFGKVGTYAVDGQVYAQPLYVPGVTIGGEKYNVVYVATEHNSVYAFDADKPQVSTALWQVNLGPSVPSGLFNFTDILPEVGILGTPAIDATNQVLYVVSDILPSGTLEPEFQLHALSLVNGQEMYGGPTTVAATVTGDGANSAGGSIAFDAFWQLQRPGLILSNGTVYVAFGSHADTGNYQGWVLGYDASTLQLRATFNTAPNGRQSGVWQAGRAPSIDSNGDVYVVSGNGDFDGEVNFGESIMHLSGTNLSLQDWYAPEEWKDLNANDQDLGASGAILIPNTNLLLAGSKAGLLYLAQMDSLGHLGPDTTSTVQGVQVNAWGVFSVALWPQANPIVYECDPSTGIKAFQIVNAKLNSTILSQYSPPSWTAQCGLSLSADGTQNGLIWLVTGNPNVEGVPGTLHALDATNLANELWNSDAAAANRDTFGRLAKFATPMVVNGRVYAPTFSNSVVIYGLLSSGPASPGAGTISAVVNAASFLDGAVAPGELVTIFGSDLGPTAETGVQLDGLQVSTTAQGISVLFDGVAAPLLYTSSSQINVVVPFGVAGPTTQIQIVNQGSTVASTTVPVQAASPALFAVNGSGGGPGAILNEDLTVNSSTNEAALGSLVVLYATGGGLTTPASKDGEITAAPYPTVPNVSVTIEGVPATVLYAGAAPGLVAGVMQINVLVPATAWVAPFDQVVVTIGDFVSPDAVTVAVKQ